MAAPTELQPQSGNTGDVRLHVVVMGPDVFFMRAIPDDADVIVGRDEEADIRIADVAASRRHARLRIGAATTIEDLGSANGTTLRDIQIQPNTPVPLNVGEAIGIGSTTLMLQRRRAAFRPRRIWPHGYFEGRLEEECERADHSESSFSVVRVRVGRGDATDATAQALSSVLRPGDLLALYGPQDYEILFVETSAAQARALTKELGAVLKPIVADHAIGLASYPQDGQSAESLISVACARVNGDRQRVVGPPNLVIQSEGILRVYEIARKVAQGNINVLIYGETGAGKELLARYVHDSSPRAGKPIVCINCAALSETLLESELFGHERGAFTGAVQAKPGLLESAEGGSVFLDEIGEMSLVLQSKILRVIEERKLTRVGGLRPQPINVRFISATNRDLLEEVAAGDFRHDLFFRLNGILLTLPPLRERPDEMEALARTFASKAAEALDRAVPSMTRAALAALQAYCWPGNVRELRNMMERAVLLCDGAPIDVSHLQMDKMRVAPAVLSGPPAGGQPSGVIASEDDRIREVLARCGGNQTRAAQLMGMPRRTFCRRLKEMGIPRPRESGT